MTILAIRSSSGKTKTAPFASRRLRHVFWGRCGGSRSRSRGANSAASSTACLVVFKYTRSRFYLIRAYAIFDLVVQTRLRVNRRARSYLYRCKKVNSDAIISDTKKVSSYMISHIDIPFHRYTSIIQKYWYFFKSSFRKRNQQFRPTVRAISRLSSVTSCVGIAVGRSKLVISLLKQTFEKVPILLNNRHIFM